MCLQETKWESTWQHVGLSAWYVGKEKSRNGVGIYVVNNR